MTAAFTRQGGDEAREKMVSIQSYLYIKPLRHLPFDGPCLPATKFLSKGIPLLPLSLHNIHRSISEDF